MGGPDLYGGGLDRFLIFCLRYVLIIGEEVSIFALN